MEVKDISTELESAAPGEAGKKQKKAAKPRRKLVRRIIIAVLLLALVAAAAVYFLGQNRADTVSPETLYTYGTAGRRDIVSELEGNGTLQPANSYTVMTLVSGEILAAAFEEGDTVSKGDVLYEIDSSDASTSIERAESSLEQNQKSYNKKLESKADLNITAPISGVITGITAAVGDNVGTQGAVATIEDISTLTLTEYYSEEYRAAIYAGMAAAVSVPSQMLNLTGRVTEVSPLTRTSETGVSCFAVTVSVSNPGSLTSGAAASGILSSGGGELYPTIADDDGLDAKEKRQIFAEVSGEVAQVNAHNYEAVTAGQLIMALVSETLDDEIESAYRSLRDAQLSLQSQYDTLDNYTVTAPIDGTIIEKYYKEGETSEGGKTLCTIYDLSSLSLMMSVDELDISDVAVGQRAEISTDSVEGRVYTGVVTRVGVNGTTSSGVTTYPVTIRIDETDGLLPGMNVDITILVEEREGALAIPAAAVARGGRVLVKTDDGSTGDGSPLEGFAYVTVMTGLSDGDFVEIISGLSEDSEIAYINDVVVSGGMDMNFGFNMGGGAMAQGGATMPQNGGAARIDSGGTMPERSGGGF